MENHCAGGGGAGSRGGYPPEDQRAAGRDLPAAHRAALAAVAAVCACRRGGTALQIGMGLMLGGALANLIERWARGSVTDYVYLPRAVIPFFRRIIWNAADLSILTGCTTAVIALLCEEL